jgi:hypothetical protein
MHRTCSLTEAQRTNLVNASEGARLIATLLRQQINELSVDHPQLIEIVLLNRSLTRLDEKRRLSIVIQPGTQAAE